MSVKRELERWAAARMANVTDPVQLARYIRRILRGVDTYKLEALGGAGFSGEQREARPGDKEITDVPGPVFALDSGLLVSSADPSYPLTIYCGTELAAYFASTGTEIIGRLVGGNPVYEFLVGVAEASETICSGAYAIPDWTDTAPTLDADDGYDSAVWTSGTLSAEPQSSLYSGLMRLGVQCKIGARKDAEDLCGFTSLNAAAHGLMLDKQTYAFWSVQVNSSGAAAKKLQNSENSECIREQLAAGDIAETSADYIRYLAWLISDLTPSTESEVALLTSAQVADVYSNGKAPIAHGWKFSRFSNKASIVTYWETTYGVDEIPCGESGMWTVSVSFDVSGAPTASLTNDTALTQFRVAPFYHSLWYPAAGQHVILRQAFGSGFDPDTQYDAFAGNEAAIYCWYDQDDTLQTITYLQYAKAEYASGRNTAQGSSVACGGSDGFYRTETITGAHATHSGGYINSAQEIGGLTQQTLGSMTVNQYEWTYGTETGTLTGSTALAAIDTVMSVQWSLRTSSCNYDAVEAWKDAFYATPTPATLLPESRIIHYGSGSGTHVTEIGTRQSFNNIVIIPSADAEAAYQCLLDSWTGGSRRERYGENEGNTDVDSNGNAAAIYHAVTPKLSRNSGGPYTEYPQSPVPHGIGFSASVGGGASTGEWQQFVFSIGNTYITDTTDSSATRSHGTANFSAAAVSPVVDQAYSAWDYYIWSGQTDDYKEQRVEAVTSFFGSSIHSIDDALTIELAGGYSKDYASLPAYKRWSGWV